MMEKFFTTNPKVVRLCCEGMMAGRQVRLLLNKPRQGDMTVHAHVTRIERITLERFEIELALEPGITEGGAT